MRRHDLVEEKEVEEEEEEENTAKEQKKDSKERIRGRKKCIREEKIKSFVCVGSWDSNRGSGLAR